MSASAFLVFESRVHIHVHVPLINAVYYRRLFEKSQGIIKIQDSRFNLFTINKIHRQT